jgi:type IV pilus assembly protein PilP
MMQLEKKVLIILFLVALSSCSKTHNDDLLEYIKAIKQRKLNTVESIPEFAFLPRFKFPLDNNRRDPFKPINQKEEGRSGSGGQVKQILETYPLERLKFVGTLSQDNRVWALIKRPDSEIVLVHQGEYLGQNHGRIIEINNHLIKLEEEINEDSGKEKRSTLLSLYTGA